MSTSVYLVEDPDHTPRQRGAAGTREAILKAARVVFTRSGYDSVGVREIAALAGVNAALVNRYFGGKERLFAEAVPSAFSVQALIGGERQDFGRNLARFVLTKPRLKDDFDPTVAMLRSAPSPEAAGLLRQGMDDLFVAPLAEWLGGENSTERAAMIVALLAGLSVMRDVLGLSALQDADIELLVALAGPAIQSYVDGRFE